MRYYFPGLLSSPVLAKSSGLNFPFTTNSGENALRLLLRSFNLPKGANVAIPAFVCEAVKNALRKEELKALTLNIYPANSYWTNYDAAILNKEKPAALVLVHLYGFLHPETDAVMEYCKANNIHLIHDLAQCYGVDESKLTYGSIFYSFSAGKSTTAAGGGIIKNMDAAFYNKNINKPHMLANAKAELFMKSRIFGCRFTAFEKLKSKLLGRFNTTTEITSMTELQKSAAVCAMKLVNEKRNDRITRYNILTEAIKDNPFLSLPANNFDGLYFKFIVFVKDDVARFRKYLAEAAVPFFSLFTEDSVKSSSLENFRTNGFRFIELSTEAAIPMEEIKRVAEKLKAYK